MSLDSEQEFFGQIWALFQLFKNSQTQLVTFDSFLCLINELQQKGLELERHIAPQVSCCCCYFKSLSTHLIVEFETLENERLSMFSSADDRAGEASFAQAPMGPTCAWCRVWIGRKCK